MGKDLKGKELGKNLSQTKEKKYLARFTDKYGKRHNYTSDSLQECKKWLADSIYEDETTDLYTSEQNMSVQAWYEYWIGQKEKRIKQSSIKSYKDYYRLNVQPMIGNMLMKDVKVQHLQRIVDNLERKKRTISYIKSLKRFFGNMFKMAVDYGIIKDNPLTKVDCNVGIKSKKKEAMTKSEQKRFLEIASESKYIRIYRFLLQTGLRISELIGLKWDDIDFDKRILTVNRQLKKVDKKGWVYSTPKSETSQRTIYLTDEALNILNEQKLFNKSLGIVSIEWRDLVFLSKAGKPTSRITIDNDIKIICKKNNFKKVSCHIMRHTFATRCIEGGMLPKTLQVLLGHSSLEITMDLYVSVTEESKAEEVLKIQKNLLVV